MRPYLPQGEDEIEGPKELDINEISYPVYIKGPSFFAEYISREYNKHIYSVGEIHKTDFDCGGNYISLENYIEYIIEKNIDKDKVFDIFVEIPFTYIDKKNQDIVFTSDYSKRQKSPLKDFYNKFYSCLQVTKEGCKYKNARVHYMDIRHFTPDFENILYNQFIALEYLITYTGSINDTSIKDAIVYWNRVPVNNRYFVTNINNFSFDNLPDRITKQFYFIENKNISKKIKDNYENIINKISITREEIDDLNSYLHEDEELSSIKLEYNKEKIHEKFLTLSCAVMDIYMLARIFRTFKNKLNGRIGEEGDKLTPENIIIFAGANHNRNYDQFFTKNHINRMSIDTNENNCVKILEEWFTKDIKRYIPTYSYKPENTDNVIKP